jgi:hypothetical protein
MQKYLYPDLHLNEFQQITEKGILNKTSPTPLCNIIGAQYGTKLGKEIGLRKRMQAVQHTAGRKSPADSISLRPSTDMYGMQERRRKTRRLRGHFQANDIRLYRGNQ